MSITNSPASTPYTLLYTPAFCPALRGPRKRSWRFGVHFAHPCARFSPPLHLTLYTLRSLLAVLCTAVVRRVLLCSTRWFCARGYPAVLLCLLPTGSPMTPASWSVRRISFGYFCVVQTSAISRRASSCHWLNPRRICRVNPRLFLCLFPRMPFGYSRLPAICPALEIPISRYSPPLHLTPYTLHLTVYTLHSIGCLVHGGGPPCSPLLHPFVLCSRLPREFFYVYYPRGPR